MLIGTTPTHYFNVAFDTSLIKKLKITYSQCDVEVLSKKDGDCVIEEGRIVVKLSQEDTFRFKRDMPIAIQIRFLSTGGEVVSSDLMMATPGMCLDNEVLE